MIMHWTGSDWSTVSAPGSNTLLGTAALATGDVWAVGLSGFDTRTLHYYALCNTLTPTPMTTVTPSETPTGTSTERPTNTPTSIATGTPLVTPTRASTYTATETPTNTSTPTSTSTETQVTPRPTTTPTVCTISFTDVQPGDYFFEAVRFLYCGGVISGYGDGTFRPQNNTTRGQLCKIVVLAEGWQLYSPPTPTFTDVPAGHPFYAFVETAYEHGVISGYAGAVFLPGNPITRGQLCKVVALAEDWPIYLPPEPTFADVPADYPFYGYIETSYQRGIISGYGSTFLPGNYATRGQICKIVFNAVTLP